MVPVRITMPNAPPITSINIMMPTAVPNFEPEVKPSNGKFISPGLSSPVVKNLTRWYCSSPASLVSIRNEWGSTTFRVLVCPSTWYCTSWLSNMPTGTTQVARLVKMATKNMITSVSGIAHFLAGCDSVTADMKSYPCCKAKRLSMQTGE